jgi:hypothetical protein
MAFADDFSIAVNGDIRHVSGSTNYTVLQMHRALQALSDDAVAAGDDIMDISVLTPSDRSTDNIVTLLNGYNIDDASAVFLYDGSITQDGGDTIYAGLVVVGAVEAGTNIIILQDNALLTDTWTSAPNADAAANILMRKVVKTRVDGADINGQRIICMAREFGDTYAEFSVTMALGNNVAALFTSADGNNTTLQATVNAWGITNTEGYQELEISGTAPAEPYYSQWDLGVQAINDLYEFAKDIQRRGTAETIHGMNGSLFRGITHSWLYDGIVGTEPATNDSYSWGAFLDTGAVTGGPFVVGEKVTGTNSGAVGRILAVDTTGTSLVVSTESGTWENAEVLTGFTSSATATTSAGPVGQATGGGTGIVLAADSAGDDDMYVQIIAGSAPADNAICYEATDHTQVVAVFGTVTARTVSTPFIGSSTGSALLGAFGIGVDPTDTAAADRYIDLDGNTIAPPNNVTFTVSGLVTAEDRVLVGPEAGGILELAQDTTNDVGLNTSGVTSVTVTTAIPLDTPSSGTIRIETDDGRYLRVPYSSYTGSVYTIPSFNFTAPDNCTTGNNVFISYIDKLAENSAVTAGSFVIGVAYVITTAGTTDFTLIGAADSVPGTLFTATGVGTGTGTATPNLTTESFTAVYQTDRDLFIRVRDGDTTPIKTFETPGTLGSSGGSASAIRTSDA